MPPIPGREKCKLVKVISGGQTGVDQAALRAARAFGIQTGGWIPRGGKTEDGFDLELVKEYHLTETHEDGYPARTKLNIKGSDGTIRIAHDFDTAGEMLTLKTIWAERKPHLDVNMVQDWDNDGVDRGFEWMTKHKIRVLNVAGNRESTHVGIGELAEGWLRRLFAKMDAKGLTQRVQRKVLAVPPSLLRNIELPSTTEMPSHRLAINLFDITNRLDPKAMEGLLGGKVGATPINMKMDRIKGEEEVAVEFTCPLLMAATVCDILRSHDREAGDFETRLYIYRKTWTRIPSKVVLTRSRNGKTELDPKVFAVEGPDVVIKPLAPEKVF